MSEPTIKIPYGDWLTEYKASAIKPKTRTDLLDTLQETSMKPVQLARLAIVAREQGDAEESIVPPNKISLQLGTAVHINRMVAKRRKPVEVNGRDHQVREFVGKVENKQADEAEDDDSPTFVEVIDPAALERAEQYLARVAPGHIRERLVIIAANKGDVEKAAAVLKAQIDDMVADLTR